MQTHEEEETAARVDPGTEILLSPTDKERSQELQ